MDSFGRRPGERAEGWRASLRRVDASALTDRQLNDLTAARIEADLAVRREARSVARIALHVEAHAANGMNGTSRTSGARRPSRDSTPADALGRAKAAVQALPPADRARLIRWIQGGMKD